jgi:predicted ATPase
MKVKEIRLNNFKRFNNLTITNISESAKLIVVVGPNGSGKSSLFDAFHHFYRQRAGWGWSGDTSYYSRNPLLGFDSFNSVLIDFYDHDGSPLPRNAIYFRSAYRHEPDFHINQFYKMNQPFDDLKVNRSIDADQTVSENYQRLVQNTMQSLYSESNNMRTVEDLRDELIGKIRFSFNNIFPELILRNIVDPLADSCFTFKKGDIENYPYKNLSAGEKAVFDLILDLHVKINSYSNTIFMIDEPELHIHTSLQAKLLDELYNIIPNNCQLWINTHSLGIMQKAKEISVHSSDSVNFIDFHVENFDEESFLYPTAIDKVVWEKFLSIALGELQTAFLPSNVIICEGSLLGNNRKGFDASVYSLILSKSSHNITFISGGSCNDIEKTDHAATLVLKNLMPHTKIVKLLDRDDRSEQEVSELSQNGIYVTTRRNLEGYLLDDEVIEEYLKTIGKHDKLNDALSIKSIALQASVARGNPNDDLKSASGDFFTQFKQELGLTRVGNKSDAFLKDTLAPVIKPGMQVFEEIEIMFSSILNNS